MMTNEEYEMNENRLYRMQIEEVSKAPVHEKQSAADDFNRALRESPELIGERIGWLLDGNYGYGAMRVAENVLARGPRANKHAQLVQMIAALEWRCTDYFVRKLWNRLNLTQQEYLAKAVNEAIEGRDG